MNINNPPQLKKYLATFVAAAAMLTVALNTPVNAQPFADDAEFVTDELIVQFNTTASAQHLADAFQRGALTIKKHLPAAGKPRGDSGLVLLKTKLPVAQALAALQKHPAVQYAEPNTLKRHQSTSNDPIYVTGKLWSIYGDQTSPANQYGCQAGEAWAAGNVGPLDGSIYTERGHKLRFWHRDT